MLHPAPNVSSIAEMLSPSSITLENYLPPVPLTLGTSFSDPRPTSSTLVDYTIPWVDPNPSSSTWQQQPTLDERLNEGMYGQIATTPNINDLDTSIWNREFLEQKIEEAKSETEKIPDRYRQAKETARSYLPPAALTLMGALYRQLPTSVTGTVDAVDTYLDPVPQPPPPGALEKILDYVKENAVALAGIGAGVATVDTLRRQANKMAGALENVAHAVRESSPLRPVRQNEEQVLAITEQQQPLQITLNPRQQYQQQQQQLHEQLQEQQQQQERRRIEGQRQQMLKEQQQMQQQHEQMQMQQEQLSPRQQKRTLMAAKLGLSTTGSPEDIEERLQMFMTGKKS
jgi:hypothetical protein